MVNNKHINPFFQVAVFLLGIMPLLVTLSVVIHRFNAHDTRPLLKTYADSAVHANTIYMGLNITDFSVFDIPKNKVIFNGFVWADFDEAHISRESVGNFSFNKGEIVHKDTPIVEQKDGRAFVRWPVRVKLHLDFNYRAFPLDNHHLFITLCNNTIDAQKYHLVSSSRGLLLSEAAVLPSWRIMGTHVDYGYVCNQLDERDADKTVCAPRIRFTLDCRKFDLRHLFSILLPLLIIFLLTLFSFSFDVEKFYDVLISISIGGISALLAYRFVIESLTPDVGYFMLSDYLFILFLVAVFLVFFFNITIMHLSQRAKKLAICLLNAFVVIGCSILFYWATCI